MSFDMAGRIDFKTGVWACSGGAFRGMVAGVIARLGVDDVSRKIKAVLQNDLEAGTSADELR